jgi:uncharacterized protein (TIGR02687 family)
MGDFSTDKIKQVLSDLFDRKRWVFWYDEGGLMKDTVAELDVPGVEVLTLGHNPFTIKHRVLRGEQPERGFLIYSTEAQPADEDNWLLDLLVEAAPFSADMGSLYAAECGIPMELKAKVVDAHLEFFKVTANRTRLIPLLQPGMDVDVIGRKMIEACTKTEASCDQLTYKFAQESLDGESKTLKELETYHLAEIYWAEVESTYGYTQAHHIKDLIIVLFEDDMNRSFGTSTLNNEARIFMRDWRDSRTYEELYKQWAQKLQQELGIQHRLMEHEVSQLVSIETYPCVDLIIAQYLVTEVLNSTMTLEQMEILIDMRAQKLFFSTYQHVLLALLEARRMVEAIDRLMNGLVINSAKEGFDLYCRELYTIDLAYRHYFREAKADGTTTQFLGDVTEMVQKKYSNSYLNELAKRWQPLVDGMGRWAIDGVLPQSAFYKMYVESYVSSRKKLFVIISDALRYETMKELQQRIDKENRMKTEMKPAMVSTQPSYTQLGMAALLPHSVLSYDKDRTDEVFADGMSTKGTESRDKVLKRKHPNCMAMRAEELLSITAPKTAFKDFDLIYIYSNTIDAVGDKKDTEDKVFAATEDEFTRLINIIKVIKNGNGTNILITSDHGYLYQNETLDESEFTDFKVMGDIIADTRRFVIGNNLQPGDAVKTWNSEEVGLKAGRQIQIAKAMNRLRKSGSGSRFVHGGSMLQEIVVPVLHVNITRTDNVSQVDVDILNKSTRLTTNNQTISFYQLDAVTEKVQAITLRIGFFDAQGTLISDSLTLTFNSTSADSNQREQKHMFVFKNQLSQLNGQEVTLKMERKLENSEQFTAYKQVAYKVSVMFQAEF